MALIDDIDIINNAETAGNWTTNSFDSPGLSSGQPTPNHVEGSDGAFWPLKKGTTGYTYTNVISGTPSMTGRILVALIKYAFADIVAIPITAMGLRVSSATTFTTNYGEIDALAQIQAPENTPVDGHVPIILYEDNATESGTPNYGTVESVGITATTGGTNDGKQGVFDWMFLIGYIGGHSATFTETFLSDLAAEYYDGGGSLPGTTSRPIGAFSRAGNFYQSNIKIRLGDGASDTANIDVTETNKVIFWNNLHVNHELGWVAVNPSSSHEARLNLVGGAEFWNDQSASAEIIEGVANLDYCKVTGRTFINGGQVPLPSSGANKWVRGSTFDGCQAATGSDGEFTNNIVSNGLALTFTGDADLVGTQFLTPIVAVDGSPLIWNGNFDPDGNLDGTIYTKGANAHHAIEFGVSSPLTMTLRNIPFGTSFSATNALNDSTLHIKRTTGTVTINLIGCSGNISYKTAGATVILVSSVPITVNVLDPSGAPEEGASVYIISTTAIVLANGVTNASGVLSTSYGGALPLTVDTDLSAVRSSSKAIPYKDFTLSGTVVAGTGYTNTVLLSED